LNSEEDEKSFNRQVGDVKLLQIPLSFYHRRLVVFQQELPDASNSILVEALPINLLMIEEESVAIIVIKLCVKFLEIVTAQPIFLLHKVVENAETFDDLELN
jgi:hypothetical protein